MRSAVKSPPASSPPGFGPGRGSAVYPPERSRHSRTKSPGGAAVSVRGYDDKEVHSSRYPPPHGFDPGPVRPSLSRRRGLSTDRVLSSMNSPSKSHTASSSCRRVSIRLGRRPGGREYGTRGREGQDFPPAGNRPSGAVQDKFPDLQPLGERRRPTGAGGRGCGTGPL